MRATAASIAWSRLRGHLPRVSPIIASIAGRYDQAIDRESAYEVLQSRAKQTTDTAAAEADQQRSENGQRGGGHQRQSPMEAMITSAARRIGTQIGRQIVRGILCSLIRR
jgi:uncharacterized protein